MRRTTLAAVLLSLLALPALAADFTVNVDARETPRGLLHVTQQFSAKAGAFALSYPKWIPGEHAPTGPNTDVAGLVIKSGNAVLEWTRDPADMNTVRVKVPAGATRLDVAFDFLLDNGTDGFTSAACSTPNLLLLSWNQVAMYPAGRKSDAITCDASLRLPDRWQHASALDEKPSNGATILFRTCTFTTLVDSPVLCGLHFRTVELTPGDSIQVRMQMACDSEEGLKIPDSEITAMKNLVKQARALFGTEHYKHYDFLITLSDHTAHFGLEHHQSSDDRGDERWWLDDALRLNNSNLLSHEYVHSWNGKFRRPAGLATGDYFTPMEGEMLWVYEGLTQYLGFVLAARAGIRTADETRDALAAVAADLEAQRGRTWRPLVDTGTEAQLLYEGRDAWSRWRRGVDFYDEGLLLWLDADVLIRKLSKGTRSLDDFCKKFHGGPNAGAEVKPYTLDEVVSTLNSVWPYEWAAFIHDRVYAVAPHAPTNGITAGGWRVGWADSLGPIQKSRETADKKLDESYSLGVLLKAETGDIIDITPGSPADAAGLAPDMKLIAVNGRRYSSDVLRDAIAATRQSGRIDLLCENKEFFRTFALEYREGRRHPVLVRDNGVRDFVGEVLAPVPVAKR
ncbi:MAG: M61 family peptidase [Candidatus Eisenbacteria bacterium]